MQNSALFPRPVPCIGTYCETSRAVMTITMRLFLRTLHFRLSHRRVASLSMPLDAGLSLSARGWKPTYELITLPSLRSSVAAGLKYLLAEGWIPPATNPQGATRQGLAARINHSSNLREIAPRNRLPGFVISAWSVVKRLRCIVLSSLSVWRKRWHKIECFD